MLCDRMAALEELGEPLGLSSQQRRLLIDTWRCAGRGFHCAAGLARRWVAPEP
jgi:hypothetical protein